MVTNNSKNEPTGSSGKVVQGQGIGTASAFSTATYPSTATGTGKILRADGTNWVATTATFPDLAGNPNNVLTSNGTNWSSAAYAATGVLEVQGTLTNSQIKNIHATPIQIIPAPGAGKVIFIIHGGAKLNYGGTNVFVAGAAQSIRCFYSTTDFAAGCATNALIVSSSTQIYAQQPGSIATTATANVSNTAVNLYNSVATEISGNAANDNTISFSVIYQILTF